MSLDTRRIIAFVALLSVLVRTFYFAHGACESMPNRDAHAVAHEMMMSDASHADARDRHCADDATPRDVSRDPNPSPSPTGSSHLSMPCGLMAQCAITALSPSAATLTVAPALMPPPIRALDAMPRGITVEPAYPPPRA